MQSTVFSPIQLQNTAGGPFLLKSLARDLSQEWSTSRGLLNHEDQCVAQSVSRLITGHRLRLHPTLKLCLSSQLDLVFSQQHGPLDMMHRLRLHTSNYRAQPIAVPNRRVPPVAPPWEGAQPVILTDLRWLQNLVTGTTWLWSTASGAPWSGNPPPSSPTLTWSPVSSTVPDFRARQWSCLPGDPSSKPCLSMDPTSWPFQCHKLSWLVKVFF